MWRVLLEGEDDCGAVCDGLVAVGAVLMCLVQRLGTLFTEDTVLAGLGENTARELLALEAQSHLPLLDALCVNQTEL